ncbi:unnamed protein product [Phytophthora fragariaefolia]|uniref:Unnamed protein product n=1 Tax=Phytophthora fragariaefolia TaxID=1490495 RepID=A0A9W6YBW3_9STRA|nr:unnamed protein product [Phytophthora fragariaefolia]
MGGTDAKVPIQDKVTSLTFTGNEDNHQPFAFTWSYDDDDRPHVGTGSDQDLFLMGMTTKHLLHQLARDPATFVLNVDGTYKLKNLEYPVYVVGIWTAHVVVGLLSSLL